MSKIYCSVYNGIGNQLFSYALGLYLAKKHNKTLVVDLTKLHLINFLSRRGLKKDTPRQYELDKLGFLNPTYKFLALEFIKNKKWILGNKYLFADFRKTHHDLGNVPENQNIYCVGWGNFEIVKTILPDMQAIFRPNFVKTSRYLEAEKIIRSNNAVALHIRRTDYLHPKISSNFSGISTDEYYRNAVAHIKSKVEHPYFVVFSDDVQYIKQNMFVENGCIIEGNAGFEDLCLMQLCRHFVLANSTFGFWAAMLNDNKEKVVCVPEFWYNSPLRKADYVPKEWVKIKIN